jgi:hypothetical protein
LDIGVCGQADLVLWGQGDFEFGLWRFGRWFWFTFWGWL